MTEYTEILEGFLKSNNIKAELIRFQKEVTSCRAAASLMKIPLDEIIKSILFISQDVQVLAIALGSDKIDFEKLNKIVGSELALAEPKQVLEITGYPAGGVPPIGIYGVKVIVDKKILQKERVIAGGGDQYTLLKIDTKDIVEANENCLIESIVK